MTLGGPHPRDEARTDWMFVESAADVDGSFTGTTVVLDPGWAPLRDTPANVMSALPPFGRVLEQHDLFKEALERVDEWAARANLLDRLMVGEVSYWFRFREALWHWTHERLLWVYTLRELGVVGGSRRVEIPSSEVALWEVAATLGAVEPLAVSDPVAVAPSMRTRIVGRVPSVLRRAYRRVRPNQYAVHAAKEEIAERERLGRIASRLQTLAGGRNGLVLTLSMPYSQQVVGVERPARVDPNLASVVPALVDAGLTPVPIAWGLPRTPASQGDEAESMGAPIPGWFVRARWAEPEDDARVAETIDRLRGLMHGLPTFALGDVDLTARASAFLLAQAERIVDEDLRDRAAIERAMAELAPAAVLMTHEGHKTPWLVAGRRSSVPTFAIQHGVLYERHPGYPDRRDLRHVLPTRTFVFGEFERRVLLDTGYLESEVRVSGSPRLDLLVPSTHDTHASSDQAALKDRLGISGSEVVLVVSTLWYPFMQRSHQAHMLQRLLAGALPGVHIVFKQHPGERDEGPYRALLAAFANVGGYELPKISVVRDVDLHALLAVAHAHLGHLSTVLTDAVVSGTCNLVADVQASGPPIDYVGAGVAHPVRNIDELRDALRNLPRADETARNRFLVDHFNGGGAGVTVARDIAAVTRAESHLEVDS